MKDDEAEEPAVRLDEVFRNLPLFEDPYLQMQAMNLEIVDQFLVERETELLREYIEIEQTPLPTAMFVSAMSQLWLFGVYELLRTWRQRGQEVLRWSRELSGIPAKDQPARLASKKLEIERRTSDPMSSVFYWPAYERVSTDPSFAERLRGALDRAERLFRRIEAFRVALAKHELPGAKSSFAPGAGFGRIDMTDGSIYWQVVLRGNEVDIVSRTTIAEQCRQLALKEHSMILPEAIQEKIKKFGNHSYGVKRVSLVLKDGSRHKGVYVAWNREVLRIEGHEAMPFDASDIIDAHHEPGANLDAIS